MRKQTKAFLDKTVAEPKRKLTDIYIETKDTKIKDRTIISDSASRLYNKPSSQLYLKQHRDLAKKTKVELLGYASRHKDKLGYASLANTISEQILDRTDGKAVAMIKTESTNLNINVEASEELKDQFTEFMKKNTSV